MRRTLPINAALTAFALLCIGGALSIVSPMRAQDASFELILNLESTRIWPSQTENLALAVQFTNRLNEPLRWMVPKGIRDNLVFGIILERQDGQRFLVRGPHRNECYVGNETTGVLPPGSSASGAWLTGSVISGDLGGFRLDENDMALHEGDLPVGEYEAWAETLQGPPLNSVSAERSPAEGIYTSPRVHLSVVAEGTPLAQAPRLKRGTRRHALVGRVGRTEVVRSSALRSYGITLAQKGDQVVLKRGSRQVRLPERGLRQGSGGRAELTCAIPLVGRDDRYVPLRRVARELGLEVRFDPKTRVYDLQPAPVGRATRASAVPVLFQGPRS